MYQTLLVPLDISEESLIDVVRPAVEFLSTKDIKSIHFVHVIPNVQYYCDHGFGLSYFPKFNKYEFERKAMEKLKDITGGFDLPGKKTLNVILTGRIHVEIINYSKKLNSGLIIMGSRHPSVSTLFLGSSANAVIYQAISPVLIVR